MKVNSPEEFIKYLETSNAKRGKTEVENGHFISASNRTFKDIHFANFSLSGNFTSANL